jgi:hypothetical protein
VLWLAEDQGVLGETIEGVERVAPRSGLSTKDVCSEGLTPGLNCVCSWGEMGEITIECAAGRAGRRGASPSAGEGSWTEYGGGGRLFIVAMAAAQAAFDSLAPRQ